MYTNCGKGTEESPIDGRKQACDRQLPEQNFYEKRGIMLWPRSGPLSEAPPYPKDEDFYKRYKVTKNYPM